MTHIMRINEMLSSDKMNDAYGEAMRKCGIDDNTIDKVEQLVNLYQKQNKTIAEKICEIAIQNGDCFDIHDGLWDIEIDIPQSIGDFEYGYLRVFPYDKPITDSSVSIKGYYKSDNTDEYDEWTMGNMDKKDQQEILIAFSNAIKSKTKM